MKQQFQTLGAGLLIASLAAAPVALAHHGFGNFAMDEDITVSGVVTKIDFVNPHSWVHFTQTNPDGTVTQRRCELRSATTLRRSGWTPEMFAVGTKITIQGSPDRNEKDACYTSTLTFADGTVLDRYGQRIAAQAPTTRAARTADGKPNLAGDWAVEQLVMTDAAGRDGTLVPLSTVGNFARGAVPEGQREIPGARGTPEAQTPRTAPAGAGGGGGAFGRPAVALTPAGEAAQKALPQLSRAERACAPGSIVSDWGGEPVNRITQTPNAITIQYGRTGMSRIVNVGMAAHPANVAPSRAGHSIGKWENDVLVVDTVGFLPGTLVGTTPHSAALHVVERFSLDPAKNTLKRDVTAEDAQFFTAPYTSSTTMLVSTVPYEAEVCQDLTPVVPPAPAAAPAAAQRQ
ncbi:MAG TPA: DUF6152 family protein [Gammaproteobacteria bacterium]|nr:DUF6152 family protein [Gammaproteobacteria bacterium]